MKHKRLTAIVMSLVLMMSSSLMIFAGNDNTIDDVILEQAIAMNSNSNLTDDDFTVVTLEHGFESINNIRSIGKNEKAIQKVEVSGDTKTVTTILPFKITEEGELVNSFEYQENASSTYASGGTTFEFVNLTFTVTVAYDVYTSTQEMNNFYRHRGVMGYWDTYDSSASVTHFKMTYESIGNLHEYDKCMTDLSGSLLQRNYTAKSEVEVDVPDRGVVYSDFDIMPNNRVLDMSNGASHSGSVIVEISYEANGANGNYEDLYLAYY